MNSKRRLPKKSAYEVAIIAFDVAERLLLRAVLAILLAITLYKLVRLELRSLCEQPQHAASTLTADDHFLRLEARK